MDIFIDADERCTPELGKEIRETIEKMNIIPIGLNEK